ncbi:hypothetical protein BHE74_00020516 [Ensete ventricosum]|nr:hypothetical protein BHE74_00020516 [Ensete ventricosum]
MKSYKNGFAKKHDGKKIWAKSRFDYFSCTISKIQNAGHSQCIIPWDVIRVWFCQKM